MGKAQFRRGATSCSPPFASACASRAKGGLKGITLRTFDWQHTRAAGKNQLGLSADNAKNLFDAHHETC